MKLRIRLRAIAIALVVGAAIPAGGAWLLAGALSRPAPARLGNAPPDLGAETVRLTLPAGDAVGWFTRGRQNGGAVLLLHPLRGNRATMLGRARFLRRAGYSVLLLDLPAHGESAGERITFGARESAAARAGLAYLRRAVPGERVGALGVSLGGASLLLGEPGPAANGANALVLEAVYPTIDEAVADRLRIRLGALGPPLAPLLTVQLRPRLGVGAEALRPIERVRELRVPLLVVAGEADRHTTLAESRRLHAAAPSPKGLWVVPRAPHADFHALAPAEYERRILAFFRQHLQAAS